MKGAQERCPCRRRYTLLAPRGVFTEVVQSEWLTCRSAVHFNVCHYIKLSLTDGIDVKLGLAASFLLMVYRTLIFRCNLW